MIKISNLTIKQNYNLVFKSYKNFLLKLKKNKQKLLYPYPHKVECFNFVLKRLKKEYPILKKTKKVLLKIFLKKVKLKKIKLKKSYKLTLTKRLKKLLKKFNKTKGFFSVKNKLVRRLRAMNRLTRRKKMRKNLRKKTFFFKILRKSRRRKIKMIRINRNQPIFTKKLKKERKFLLKARESLLKTKKYLYRKQFPKIKGKKNKNFNFFYYNNMDRIPFKFNIGRIVITYLLNNTFINIHNSKKMLKVFSAGKLGFRGPKRSTPYSRQVVARKAINFVAKTKLNILDIFLNSNYNRWYYFIFKEISKPKVKPYYIRYLVVSNSRAHGFIRDRKHRRK